MTRLLIQVIARMWISVAVALVIVMAAGWWR